MYEKIRDQYDSLYSAQSNVFGAGKPLKVVVELPSYLSSGRILDIGGGEGRNALYLAERGYTVTVYDISAVGIAHLQESAKAQGVTITTKVVDVSTEAIEGTYDAVINSFVLHHLSDSDARKVIADTQSHTAENGVNILYTYANEGGLYERNQTSGRFYPNQATIEELYADWEIVELHTYEAPTHAKNKQGERMQNMVLSMVARKR